MSFRPRRADEAVVHRFATACGAGSIGAIRSLLAAEVVVVSDGGGKVAAALSPVRGADAVARWGTAMRSAEAGSARMKRNCFVLSVRR